MVNVKQKKFSSTFTKYWNKKNITDWQILKVAPQVDCI
jgi:hypothetical protein